MQPLLDAIVAYVPPPAERPFLATAEDDEEIPIEADGPGPAAAFVWKTVADPFAGRITLFRVLSGSVKSDSTRPQRHARCTGAARPPGAAAGQDADERARNQGR